MIYFIKAGEFVKIGYCAADPKARRAQLQVGNPVDLRLIAIKEGDMAEEAVWHRRFAHLRVRGEWFKWHDDIRDWARPLLEDPNADLDVRNQYARALVAGREDERLDLFEKLFSNRSWSAERRAAFVARGRDREAVARLTQEPTI